MIGFFNEIKYNSQGIEKERMVVVKEEEQDG